jgi:hypothetical protein
MGAYVIVGEPAGTMVVTWTCRVRDCDRTRTAGALMCGEHWAQVPAPDRAVFRAASEQLLAVSKRIISRANGVAA